MLRFVSIDEFLFLELVSYGQKESQYSFCQACLLEIRPAGYYR